MKATTTPKLKPTIPGKSDSSLKATMEPIIHHNSKGSPATLLIDIAGLTPQQAHYLLNVTKILLLEVKASGTTKGYSATHFSTN